MRQPSDSFGPERRPPPFTYRRMTPNDLDRIMEIEKDGFAHPWSADLLRRELMHDWSTILLATERRGGAEVVLGFVVFWLVHDELHVLNIATALEARRRGVGWALMEEAAARSGTGRWGSAPTTTPTRARTRSSWCWISERGVVERPPHALARPPLAPLPLRSREDPPPGRGRVALARLAADRAAAPAAGGARAGGGDARAPLRAPARPGGGLRQGRGDRARALRARLLARRDRDPHPAPATGKRPPPPVPAPGAPGAPQPHGLQQRRGGGVRDSAGGARARGPARRGGGERRTQQGDAQRACGGRLPRLHRAVARAR